MRISRFAKFIGPTAVAAALALITVGIHAQPATAMTKNQCRDLANSFYKALALGDYYYGIGNNQKAIFHYQRAEAIANAYGELCP